MQDPIPDQLTVLYQDDFLVAVDKPSGLLVHRSMIDRRETRFAMAMVRDQIGCRVYPVHRLDKPTSGVLLFALDPETARRIGPMFAAGRVEKRYLAVVRGYTDEHGVIDYALVEQADKMTDARARTEKGAQTAVTEYRRLDTVELPFRVDRYPSSRYSLLEIRPRTGRKHQIRRHMKHIAHPVIGDTTHGKSRHNRLFEVHYGCKRLLLAAVGMRFVHPYSATECWIHAPLSGSFARLAGTFGWAVAAAADRSD